VIAGAGGCWYAFTTYTSSVAWEITGCIFAFVILLIALYALLAGALSPSNFVRIVSNVWSRVQKYIPFLSKQDDQSDKDEEDD
jgi:hypothetical protein